MLLEFILMLVKLYDFLAKIEVEVQLLILDSAEGALFILVSKQRETFHFKKVLII